MSLSRVRVKLEIRAGAKETLNTPILTLWDAGSAPGNHEETQEFLQQFYGDGTVLRHSLIRPGGEIYCYQFVCFV